MIEPKPSSSFLSLNLQLLIFHLVFKITLLTFIYKLNLSAHLLVSFALETLVFMTSLWLQTDVFN